MLLRDILILKEEYHHPSHNNSNRADLPQGHRFFEKQQRQQWYKQITD